ncbi:hypothetical protein AB1E18_019606 [Capra hircus]
MCSERYMGSNFFELIPVSENSLAIYSENFDGVKVTKATQLLAKGDGATEEEIQHYEELNKERGIPPEHIEDLTQTGTTVLNDLVSSVYVMVEGSGVGEAYWTLQVTGEWHTIYAAADNKEKIVKGGPLKCYYRQIECINDCKYPSLTFYAK